MKHLARFILRIFNWQYVGNTLLQEKAVILCAPHTSMWDYIWGKLIFWSINIYPKYLINSAYFVFPLGIILKSLGGISVDIGKSQRKLIPYIVKLFKHKEVFHLVITPEGTRKKRTKWKRGFYEIAMKANVPIYIGILDYGKKQATAGELFYPTGDYKSDLKYIQSHYEEVEAKYPSQFAKEY